MKGNKMKIIYVLIFSFIFSGICIADSQLRAGDETVKMVTSLAKQGEICKIYGHVWESQEILPYTYTYRGCVNSGNTFFGYEPQPETRTCKICGLKQIKKPVVSEWIDVKE